ncbi:MAG: prepilin-type N-terminal cleavage/methylation domain-containing protein [bacterium]|nr:prepilin-type N-terminal cleavage/methylation domain-containing protein [bacterium]
MTTRSRQAGFTLMELMTVITIIGILAALTGGVVSVVTKQNKVEAAKATILKIQMALEQYYNDIGAYPPTPSEDGNARVIAALTGDLNGDGVYDPTPGSGDIPRTHPRWRRPYLMVEKSQYDGNMNMVDPWRQPYRYFENEREAPRCKVNPSSFLLFSYGPDMKATAKTREEAIDPTLPYNKDNIKNWEDE